MLLAAAIPWSPQTRYRRLWRRKGGTIAVPRCVWSCSVCIGDSKPGRVVRMWVCSARRLDRGRRNVRRRVVRSPWCSKGTVSSVRRLQCGDQRTAIFGSAMTGEEMWKWKVTGTWSGREVRDNRRKKEVPTKERREGWTVGGGGRRRCVHN